MKILVTGGTGMVGAAFPNNADVIKVGSLDYDLTDCVAAYEMIRIHRPDAIIHLAARVGGIQENIDYVAELYRENILMNTHLLEAARVYEVPKLVSLLSTCVYPDSSDWPLREENLHSGSPHYSNFGYAYAKRMLDIQTRAYRKQYGCNFITAIPNNLFGENDNFDLEAGHVIPAMIRKVYEAKINNKNVLLWGDGSPLREFTYAKDITSILMFLLDNYDSSEPINIGNTKEVSIKDLATTIAQIMKYDGEIHWDTSRPNGQHRKPSDNHKLLNLGWKGENYSDFSLSLEQTCRWFEENYPNVRGIK